MAEKMQRYIAGNIFKSILLMLLLMVGGTRLNAQNGNPYFVNYGLPSGVSNQNWGFEQNENGELYVLNRRDIYSFDGWQWEGLSVMGRPIAMAYSHRLFYCTEQGVGYFDNDENAYPSQVNLINVYDDNFYYKFSRTNNGLFVVSPTTICKISTSDSIFVDTVYHDVRPEVFISDFFQLGSNTYHVKNSALIYLNKPNGGHEMLAGLPVGDDFTFSFIHNEMAFFGTKTNMLYTFDGQRLKQFKLADQQYVNASLLNGGISVNSSLIALSTLNGGCIIVDANNGQTSSTLNFRSGLPDDEIFALGTDNEKGLWISHPMGISRVDFSLPISAMSHYGGLMGNVLSCVKFDNTLYVGTGEGLFYLAEHFTFKPVDVYVKTTKQKVVDKPQQDLQQEQSISEKRKGFISRLFNRGNQEKVADEHINIEVNEVVDDYPQFEVEYRRKQIQKLESVSHVYKKVEGLYGKVRFLVVVNNSLYAATNFGLYRVTNGHAKPLVKGVNIQFAQESDITKGDILIGTNEDVFVYSTSNSKGALKSIAKQTGAIASVVQLSAGDYVFSNEFDVFLASKNGDSITMVDLPMGELGSPIIRKVMGKPFVFFKNSVFELNDGKLVKTNDFTCSNQTQFFQYHRGVLWQQDSLRWSCISIDSCSPNFNTQLLNLFENPTFINVSADNSVFVINAYKHIFRLAAQPNDTTAKPLSLFIKRILDKDGNVLNPSNVSISYADNALKVRISAPSFVRKNAVMFQYMINGLTNSWSEWSGNPFIELPFVPSGKYTLLVRAKDIIGNTSNIIKLPFTVEPPFWQTIWFYIGSGISGVLLLLLIVKLREKSLRRDKLMLELKVKQRTRTIENQKQAIEQQRDQIYKQNDEITQSITYARKIQWAVMPSDDIIQSLIGDYFIMFRPRDIVSGDFYWITQRDGLVIVVAADCTGHGVPGAFMSMMGVSFLNDIVNVEGITQPNEILNNLRQKIKATFEKTGRDTQRQDGMDVAICAIDMSQLQLLFAGAYNPLYIIRNGKLIVHKADKMPVGAYPKDNEPFSLQRVAIKPNDRLYLFSDGYVSQFGGPDGRKFMAKPFKELLLNTCTLPMDQQQTQLEDTMDLWQAANDQVDDILVIGIEIS